MTDHKQRLILLSILIVAFLAHRYRQCIHYARVVAERLERYV